MKNIFSNKIAEMASYVIFAFFAKGESYRFVFPSQILKFLFILISLLAFAACQEEIEEIEDVSNHDVIQFNSATATLVKRVALKDGSFDNILDRSSCSTVLLPITVQANGQEVMVNSESDFTAIQTIFSQSDTDKDTVVFSYPFTVIIADHSELELANVNELITLQSNCVAINDEDIECIDFIYPMTLFTYNENNLKADVITKNDDKALHEYFTSLTKNDLLALKYPMIMLLSDGQEVTVNSNVALNTSILNADVGCEENDLTGGGANPDLQSILLSNEWQVSLFFDETDKTSSFDGYKITFESTGIIRAGNGTLSSGTWEIAMVDGNQELVLEFEDAPDPIDWLDDEWVIWSYSSDKIELVELEDNGEIEERLTFEKI